MFPRSINVGPLEIHLYGLIIALAIYLGWLIASKRRNLYKIPKDVLDSPILVVPLVLGIVGARLYHVLDYWDFYSRQKAAIFNIAGGGLGIWGGLIGIFLGFWIVAKVKKLNVFSVLDLAAPSVLLGQALGRIGNFVNQEGFGPPTNLPWAVFVGPENRPKEFINSTHFHPTFFYEAILDAIFFVILLNLSKKFRKPGQAFALYLVLYSTGRFVVEFWRIDTWIIGQVKVAHILSIAVFLLGFWLFTHLGHKKYRG